MDRFTHVTTRNSPSSKTYQQPTYRDHPAAAVPITGSSPSPSTKRCTS